MTLINEKVAQMVVLLSQQGKSASQIHKAYLNNGARGRHMDFSRFTEVYGFLMPEGASSDDSTTEPEDTETPTLEVGSRFAYNGKRNGASVWVVTGYDGDVALAVRESDVTASGKPKKGVSANRWPNVASKIAKGITRKGESEPIFSLA